MCKSAACASRSSTSSARERNLAAELLTRKVGERSREVAHLRNPRLPLRARPRDCLSGRPVQHSAWRGTCPHAAPTTSDRPMSSSSSPPSRGHTMPRPGLQTGPARARPPSADIRPGPSSSGPSSRASPSQSAAPRGGEQTRGCKALMHARHLQNDRSTRIDARHRRPHRRQVRLRALTSPSSLPVLFAHLFGTRRLSQSASRYVMLLL